jgi:hypothetical protein
LGVVHGVNPAMGWLFAVALGLYRQQRRIVLLSVVPIALGHATSVALVLLLFLGFGQMIDRTVIRRAAATLLIAWAIWHACAAIASACAWACRPASLGSVCGPS